MKITISFCDLPLSISMKGPDDACPTMVELATKALFKVREIWLNALECQKLQRPGAK